MTMPLLQALQFEKRDEKIKIIKLFSPQRHVQLKLNHTRHGMYIEQVCVPFPPPFRIRSKVVPLAAIENLEENACPS